MSDSSKELLQHMFKSIPEAHRVAFLQNVFQSLEPETRARILDGSERSGAAPPPVQTIRERGSDAWASGDTLTELRDSPKPARPIKKPLTEAEKQALIDEELKKLAAIEHQPGTNYWRQGLSCMGLCLLLGVAFMGMTVGGKKFFDWIVTMFQGG